ncbi:phosphatidylinositol-specific phospholipase C domain-containing protein [Actinoalloteichus hymeniacidonis]|uniref:Phosphoinositide phospholipase C, Ca2+-dependent n=1 Tax=Actinoalloteichus hymeniacidonis TaxID=340345 RepID=A0AAC9HRK0_9PSEU|nr:phosphatidylinositol-specific phospholipase C domain-containing protein [Actinoalloteichus hymeniacidonis]AOS64267.1 hypothetical protein TL08_17335 [Actinoalloteichus hymeniacidonis]MBB5907665.1 hypothetical protein [Actinoalloteichus hymeniacidonis]
MFTHPVPPIRRLSATTRRVTAFTAAALTAATMMTAALSGSALAESDQVETRAFTGSTAVGLHNAYEKSGFPYLADVLDSGAALIELDVWTDELLGTWRVSHELFGASSNCVGASDAGGLRTGDRDQDLIGCLDDIRAWRSVNPGHRPIVFKIEMKDGFYDRGGMGPAAFDALVADRLGDAVFTPADLLAHAGGAADLEQAVTTAGWPSRDELAGRVLIELIPGTFEQGNPFDTLWTDEEYSRHLRDLAAAGELASAQAFPAVLGAEAGDPRERYEDTSLRPWFVVYDGSANAYVTGGIDTGWYRERNYLLIMTAAHEVAPAIDSVAPDEQAALDRVAQLAEADASIITSDWRSSTLLSTVVPRG